MRNQYQENKFDENDYPNFGYDNEFDENYYSNPENKQEYLKQNLNEFRSNMGYGEKKNSFRKVLLTVLACMVIAPTAYFLGHSIRQGLPSTPDPEPQIVIPQTIYARDEPFCILDNEMKEGYLSPKDFVFLKDGESQYTISSRNEFIINKSEDFRFLSSYDRDHSRYSTDKGMKLGDDWEKFLELYGDYKTDFVTYETEDGKTMVRNGLTVREFKEKYIDTGKVDLTDPSLEMYFMFSLHSDGEHIIEMIDDGHYHTYDRYMEISFNFNSNDRLGTDERTENNSSDGLHLDYMDTSYSHFEY